ncbi:MAG: hypothetical protein RIR70_1377 [Pseudomonadota bacterium]|jgi:HD-like signal output (HDOD) protein
MSVLDEATVHKELGAVKIQTFSTELEALQLCRDDDALFEQLIRAAENEPFLLARMVKVANSVVYGGNSDTYVCTASECLMRFGLTTGQQIALDFLINKSIGRITQANDFARATWNEALVAGRLSRHWGCYCEAPFDIGGPFLPTIMTYLGEVFVMSLLADESDVPEMGVYTRAGNYEFDVYGLSVSIMERLGLPKPVEDTVKQSHLLLAPMSPPYINTAAAVILGRYMVQATKPPNVHNAIIDDELRESAMDILQLSMDDLSDIEQKTLEIRQIP